MAMTSSSHTHILGIPEAAAGVGLKPEHADDIFMGRRVDFFEIHAENYMGDGGPPHHLLQRIRRALARQRLAPTLIEWDNNIPAFSTLVREVERARASILAQTGETPAMQAA
jgi:uncharacterized protein (UPF0276 family)